MSHHRIIWIAAYARRIPERPAAFIAVHAELLDAYQIDRLRERLEEEMDREFQVSLV